MAISKHAAAVMFKEHKLEGLPCAIYEAKMEAFDTFHQREMPQEFRLTVRACGITEDKNLPRLIDRSSQEVEEWIKGKAFSRYIVQPYDDLIFSAELILTELGVLAELIPGIWELDSTANPAVIVYWPGQPLRISIPLALQRSKFWFSHLNRYVWEDCTVDDWQIQALIVWLDHKFQSLQALRRQVGQDIGVKLHYSRRFGVSPQNIHTSHVNSDLGVKAYDTDGLFILTNLNAEIPAVATLVLDVRIAREDQSSLLLLINRMQERGVETVYLKSGLLSHLAITLREHGLQVKRA